jgi:hypothetical protein
VARPTRRSLGVNLPPLNPGIPAAKIVRAVPDGTVWQSAAFIYRLDAAFARAHQSFRLDI